MFTYDQYLDYCKRDKIKPVPFHDFLEYVNNKKKEKQQHLFHIVDSFSDEDYILCVSRNLMDHLLRYCIEHDIYIFPDEFNNYLLTEADFNNRYIPREKIYLNISKEFFKYIIDNCPTLVEWINEESDDSICEVGKMIKMKVIKELFAIEEYINN